MTDDLKHLSFQRNARKSQRDFLKRCSSGFLNKYMDLNIYVNDGFKLELIFNYWDIEKEILNKLTNLENLTLFDLCKIIYESIEKTGPYEN